MHFNRVFQEETAKVQLYGQQLREGGYGAVEWDDLIGRR